MALFEPPGSGQSEWVKVPVPQPVVPRQSPQQVPAAQPAPQQPAAPQGQQQAPAAPQQQQGVRAFVLPVGAGRGVRRHQRPRRYSHKGFQEAMRAKPRDTNVRKVYADWLEERGLASQDDLARLRSDSGPMWVSHETDDTKPVTVHTPIPMHEIRRRVQESGSHWFDPSSMRFFGTRISDRTHGGLGGHYFVTSEQPPRGPRGYTVRSFDPATLRIGTVGELAGHPTQGHAHRVAARLAATPPEVRQMQRPRRYADFTRAGLAPKAGVHPAIAGSRLAFHLKTLEKQYKDQHPIGELAARALRGDTKVYAELGERLAAAGHPLGDKGTYNWKKVGEGVVLDGLVRSFANKAFKAGQPDLYQKFAKQFTGPQDTVVHRGRIYVLDRMHPKKQAVWDAIRAHVNRPGTGKDYTDHEIVQAIRRQAAKEQDAAKMPGDSQRVPEKAKTVKFDQVPLRKPQAVGSTSRSWSNYMGLLPGRGSAEAYKRRYATNPYDVHATLKHLVKNPWDAESHMALAGVLSGSHDGTPIPGLIRQQFGNPSGHTNDFWDPVDDQFEGWRHGLVPVGKSSPFQLWLENAGRQAANKWVVHAQSTLPGTDRLAYSFEFPHAERHKIAELFPGAARYLDGTPENPTAAYDHAVKTQEAERMFRRGDRRRYAMEPAPGTGPHGASDGIVHRGLHPRTGDLLPTYAQAMAERNSVADAMREMRLPGSHAPVVRSLAAFAAKNPNHPAVAAYKTAAARIPSGSEASIAGRGFDYGVLRHRAADLIAAHREHLYHVKNEAAARFRESQGDERTARLHDALVHNEEPIDLADYESHYNPRHEAGDALLGPEGDKFGPEDVEHTAYSILNEPEPPPAAPERRPRPAKPKAPRPPAAEEEPWPVKPDPEYLPPPPPPVVNPTEPLAKGKAKKLPPQGLPPKLDVGTTGPKGSRYSELDARLASLQKMGVTEPSALREHLAERLRVMFPGATPRQVGATLRNYFAARKLARERSARVFRLRNSARGLLRRYNKRDALRIAIREVYGRARVSQN